MPLPPQNAVREFWSYCASSKAIMPPPIAMRRSVWKRQETSSLRSGHSNICRAISRGGQVRCRALRLPSRISSRPPICRRQTDRRFTGTSCPQSMPGLWNGCAISARRFFGKTVSTEFAWRHPGPTVNPWNPKHTPGGSSSGSAAAVAAGLVPLALGTQTLGSVVRPAAFNGVVGFKPSFGAIPRTRVHPLSPSLDHVGFFARRVDDVALALSLLAASSDRHPLGRPIPGFYVDAEQGLKPMETPHLA